MFKLVGEDKEYGVIKNWSRIPMFQARPGHYTFFLRCFESGLSVVGSDFLIALGTWMNERLLKFLSLVGSIVRSFLEVV